MCGLVTSLLLKIYLSALKEEKRLHNLAVMFTLFFCNIVKNNVVLFHEVDGTFISLVENQW